MPEAERLSENERSRAISEILRTIFQPRDLSSDIPASQEGVYIFYTLPIIFYGRLFSL